MGKGGSSGGGTGGNPTGATSIEFSQLGTLELSPQQAVDLKVSVKPAGQHRVRFSLIGDSLDGSLAATEITTGPDGTATSTLFAPSRVASFSVRAAVGTEVSASLAVSVSELGFGSLRITPSYSGERSVSSWTASVHTERRCAELLGNPPPDGALWVNSTAGTTLQLESVPAGTFYAVTVRASQFAGGCSDVSAIVAGETKQVSVQVINRPLQLGETDLVMSFGIDETDEDWQAGLSSAAESAGYALLGSADHDVAALLDAMAWALDSETDAELFETARSSGAWDQIVSAWLGPQAGTFLRDQLMQWFNASAAELSGPELIRGRLLAAPAAPGWASWQLSQVARLSPEQAGFPPAIGKLSLSADPDDSLLVGGSFFYFPTRLTMSAAERSAKASLGVGSASEALSEAVGCQELAAALADQGALFEGCDAECGALACEAGLSELFRRASDASVSEPATLRFSAAAKALIDSEARPSGFEGTWVGEIETNAPESSNLSVSGAAKGEQPAPPQ